MTEYAFSTTTVTTPRCFHCGKTGSVVVPTDAYAQWTAGHGPIQQFMAEMPEELREQLISGTHPECWDEMYPPDEAGPQCTSTDPNNHQGDTCPIHEG